MHNYCFESFDLTKKDIVQFKIDESTSKQPFGGKTMIFEMHYNQLDFNVLHPLSTDLEREMEK